MIAVGLAVAWLLLVFALGVFRSPTQNRERSVGAVYIGHKPIARRAERGGIGDFAFHLRQFISNVIKVGDQVSREQ
jgi:hypothetical protein